MVRFKRTFFGTILLSLVLSAQTQLDDWNSVENLAPGTTISVLVKHARRNCELARVTDSDLTCDHQIGRIWRRHVFLRREVREVRLEYPEENGTGIGAMVGALGGGSVGALAGSHSSDPETRVYTPIYGVLLGTIAGAVIGRHFQRHGAVIYKRA